MTQYWGGTKQFFLLILYNFGNIDPYSVVPDYAALALGMDAHPQLSHVLLELHYRRIFGSATTI